jgi:GNAT superfamily N-acetyltransferase
MKPVVNIHKAVRDDIPAIHQLVVALAEYEREPDAVVSTVDEYYQAFDRQLIKGYVAKVDDQVAGMAIWYETFSTWKGITLYLEDFFVLPEFRGFGIGQQLFDYFLAEAKDLSCRQVKWQVLDWNEPALKFYEKNGAVIEKGWWNGKIYFG